VNIIGNKRAEKMENRVPEDGDGGPPGLSSSPTPDPVPARVRETCRNYAGRVRDKTQHRHGV